MHYLRIHYFVHKYGSAISLKFFIAFKILTIKNFPQLYECSDFRLLSNRKAQNHQYLCEANKNTRRKLYIIASQVLDSIKIPS